MKLSTIAACLCLSTLPAMAQPAPAGTCSIQDDLVAEARPLGVQVERANNPQILSMKLPRMSSQAVADITFRIETDGRVTALKVLCVSDKEAGLAEELLKVSREWRFAPLTRLDKPWAVEATYRLSGGMPVPLGFIPLHDLQRIEG